MFDLFAAKAAPTLLFSIVGAALAANVVDDLPVTHSEMTQQVRLHTCMDFRSRFANPECGEVRHLEITEATRVDA